MSRKFWGRYVFTTSCSCSLLSLP